MTAAGLKTVGADELRKRLESLAAAPPETLRVSTARRRLRELAVLHGWFDLGGLVSAFGRKRRLDDATLSKFVQEDCERVRTPRGDGAWRLRLDVRRETIAALLDGDDDVDDVKRLLATLRAAPLGDDDTAGRMAKDYLEGDAPSLDTHDRDELTAGLTASTWLEGLAAGIPSGKALRGRLRQVSLMAPLEAVRDLPILGREDELDQIGAYVRRSDSLFRPLVINGPGGIGKSAVIAQFLLGDADQRAERKLFAYLTFDRDDLLPQRPVGLLAEAVRQAGLQKPGLDIEGLLGDLDSIDVRSMSAEDDYLSGTRGLQTDFIYDLMATWQAFATVLRTAGVGPLVLVLDTFERAQRQGHAAVSRLWDTLRRANSTMPELRVIILGRKPIADRDVEARPLRGLTVPVGVEVLRDRLGKRRMDKTFLTQVARQVRGIPLALRLAADLMIREEKKLHSDEGRQQFLLDLPETSVQGVLYRRVLAHLDDQDVEKLAVPGLVLRRLTPDVIRVVLAPACGLGSISLQRAQSLFVALRAETSLVDEDGDALVHRADVRQEVLPLMDPDEVTSLHRRAVKYYRHRRGTSERTEELYHRLALDQSPATLKARWDPVSAARLDAALEELPPRAQAYLANRLDLEVDPATLSLATDRDWALQTARSVRALLADGKVTAALTALEDRSPAQLDYEVAALHVEALARARRIDDARRRADSAIEAATARGDARQVVRFLLLQAQIAEDLGQYQAAIDLLTRANTTARRYGNRLQELSAGTGLLRLYRRSEVEGPDVLRLREEVVAAAEALPRRELRRSPGLLRDLAAEVPSEIPWIVAEASKLVGIDVVSAKARSTLEKEGRHDSADIVLEAMGGPTRPSVHDDGADDEANRLEDANPYDDSLSAEEEMAGPVTSGKQGSAIGDYLDSHDDEKVLKAVSDLFKSDAEAPTFFGDDEP